MQKSPAKMADRPLKPETRKLQKHEKCIRKLRSVNIKFISFRSLNPLFAIIEDEQTYSIQIITKESISTFLELLNWKGIHYEVIYSKHTKLNRKKISILYDGSSRTDLHNCRTILYAGKVDRSSVQLIFDITDKEKLKYLKNKSYVDAGKMVNIYGKTKSLHEIEKMCLNSKSQIPIPELNYSEMVMLIGIRKRKLNDIFEAAAQIDSSIDNLFMARLILNSLVNKGILIRLAKAYRLNISIEMMKKIFEKGGIEPSIFQ